MYASPTTHGAAVNAATTRPTATRSDLAAEYAKRIAAYQPTASVLDRRIRRELKAMRKALEPALPIWCKVVLAIKAIIKRCKVANPFAYFRYLGTMRTTTLIAKIHGKMARAKNKYNPLPDYGDWGAEQYAPTPMSLMLREPIRSESDWNAQTYYQSDRPRMIKASFGLPGAKTDDGRLMFDSEFEYPKPVIADRPNVGGTQHANACVGKSGNYRERSVSAGAKGKQTYLHGLPPHAVGM